MPEYVDPATRLNELIDRQERRIAVIFRTAVGQLRDELDLEELADLLAQGRVNDALDRIQSVAAALGNASNTTFITSGQATSQFLTNAGVGTVLFDQVNFRAVQAMQRNQLEMISEFTNEQRRATSDALVAGVESGTNPVAQARNFRDSIGLTTRQWAAVDRYRTSLNAIGTDPRAAEDALGRALRDGRGDAQIKAAAKASRPLPAAKIDWLVTRYSERYVAYRSRVIGRTEAMRAVNQGNHEAYQQAIDAGTIRPEQLEQEWNTTLDGRERDNHLLLHGQKRGWGEVWETRYSKGDKALKYPGDPAAAARDVIQCRCNLATRIKRN